MRYYIVSTTLRNRKDAVELAEKIVKLKLGACVQISNIKSFYNWKGNLERKNEFKLDIKTTSKNHKKLGKFILENHKYDLPEIVVTEFTGYNKYLNRIDEELR